MNAAGTGQLAGVCTSPVSGRGPLHLTPSCPLSPAPSVVRRSLPQARFGGEAESVLQAAVQLFSHSILGSAPSLLQADGGDVAATALAPSVSQTQVSFGLGHVGTLLLIGTRRLYLQL